MFKLIGSLLILGATTIIGFEIARGLSERPKQLQLFAASLETLETEIMYGHTPLGEACIKISKQLPNPISAHYVRFSNFLQKEEITVYKAWEAALKETWKQTALKQNEFEILQQFGANLGRHDRESQQKQIILTLNHLSREEKEAREKQKIYEKMSRNLGVLIGVLIILLLL
ncbi:stage III sporulation protein SpoIIIAB [Lederbergia galactosidilytica]|uniref:Stage III sporulation protein SpoAB n=1 Tax=Lederbergia galactosidilytica TaxID=217031 RepID=A0A0Q9XTR0_9BACI|nr:stage III sporulation protein SpoIIIAB [Lederbergia galactosidilytica]KRG11606.1 stage III sporulation protein SpoAB [Lederbergia galactosidilytica]KRG15642.1 stage III sporulation protein SpoAB [Virgibacillus soli]MBP1914748.1 stage III sporulation protein AB [Lederbergia galactosidilytica]OAK75325.1 stage III sporulation protein SpoAB [Lederbergia galactosidilytica]